MTPYEMTAGSLFMVKEATLQKILQSIGDSTGADPTRLQDALVGLAGGGAAGAGIGAMAGGGKGALIGGLLGGGGGAAGGYAGSPYIREMLEKLMSDKSQDFIDNPQPGQTAGPDQVNNLPQDPFDGPLPPEIIDAQAPQAPAGIPDLRDGLGGGGEGPPQIEPGAAYDVNLDPESMSGPSALEGLASLSQAPDAMPPLMEPGSFGPSLDIANADKSLAAQMRDARQGQRTALRDVYSEGTIGDLLGHGKAKVDHMLEGPRGALDRSVIDLLGRKEEASNGMTQVKDWAELTGNTMKDTGMQEVNSLKDRVTDFVDTGRSGLNQMGTNARENWEGIKKDPLTAPIRPWDMLLTNPHSR